MIGKSFHLLSLTKYLLAFIFCGAIIGEATSLSIVVTAYGSEIVGKLYLVNALLLMLLPLIFFRYIDKVNRGILLANTMMAIVAILVVFAGILYVFSENSRIAKVVTAFLYPVSYLSKTLLFLTFWTYLNDIYNIQESKKYFPIIAAWGFVGAIAGVVIARGIISVMSIKEVFLLWVSVYAVAWFLASRVRYKATRKFRPREEVPETKNTLFGVTLLLRNKLVQIIAIIYFGTFLAIFSMDFLFWKNCYIWCKTTSSVASFQFTFFIVHACITIALFRFVLPAVINRIGFTKIMYGLPLLFIFGGALMIVIELQHAIQNKMMLFAIIQFFRQVLFELTFASSYQMFFAVLVQDQRGRAKTLLEGIVKPCAIFSSGAIVVVVQGNACYLQGIIVAAGMVLSAVIYYLRRIYITTIMQRSQAHMDMREIIDCAGQAENAAFYRMVMEFADSDLEDMKVMAVELLKKVGTSHAFSVIVDMYERERGSRIKEMIARSISVFYSYRTRAFAEKILNENNYRIRANAIFALNTMQCNWKKYLKPVVAPLLFENNLRVQLEAAFFLWQHGTAYEKNTVQHFLKNLLSSDLPNRMAAGIYLCSLLKIPGWENLLIDNLSTTSFQVFTKSVEVLINSASREIIERTLADIDGMSRKKMTIAGKIIGNNAVYLCDILQGFFPKVKTRRFSFEIVACLRKAADELRFSAKEVHIEKDVSESIKNWILQEIEIAYCDAYHFYNLINNGLGEDFSLLENTLHDRQTRLCGWAISVMVITDTKGILVWRSADMDINEAHKRNDLVEVLESMPQDKVSQLILPLLKVDSWETLSKTAKICYHFDKTGGNDGISYFMRSEHRMIVMSILYVIEKKYEKYSKQLNIRECLTMLEKNSDETISVTAEELLAKKNCDTDKHTRAFELLERVLFFKKNKLFHNISADKMLRIAELVHLVHYKKDDVVSVAGCLSDQVYIIKNGVIRIERYMNGENALLRYVGSGEIYGETGLFSKVSRTTSAVAEEPAEVYILKRTDMKRLIREIPDIALNFLETLSEMLHAGGEEMQKIKNNSYSTENE